jgi:hypothetical protein
VTVPGWLCNSSAEALSTANSDAETTSKCQTPFKTQEQTIRRANQTRQAPQKARKLVGSNLPIGYSKAVLVGKLWQSLPFAPLILLFSAREREKQGKISKPQEALETTLEIF